MSEPRWDVPGSWAWAAAGDIADVIGGGTPNASDPSNFSEDGVPWLTPADLTGYKDTYVTKGRRDLSDKGIRTSGATLLPPGTVLFSSRAPVGYCAIASDSISTNQGFKSFVLKGGIVPEYMRHYLLASKEYAESLASGTTFKELSGARAAQLAVPIAPVTEQRRIVAKLERLFERTTSARTELAHIPLLVEHYKQAIIDQAFAMIEDRRALHELVTPERGIPYGIVQTGTPMAGGIPTVRCGDIKGFQIDRQALKPVSPDIESSYLRTRLQGGEVLIAIRGSVGETCVASEELIGCNISREVAMIPLKKQVLPHFIMYFLASSEAKEFILGNVKGVAQQGINLRDLRNLPAPICDLDEQSSVVRRIDSSFDWIDRILGEREKAATLLDHLDSGLLRKAFRGELVPQEPSDEPAERLLERIRTERNAEQSTRRTRRGKA